MQIDKNGWCAVILAGGSGKRMGCGTNKVLLTLWDGQCPLQKSVEAFFHFAASIVVVIRREDEQDVRSALKDIPDSVRMIFAYGGDTRQESVWNGLCSAPADAKYVMIHDAARCLVGDDVVMRVRESVLKYGTGVASIPLTDTIKQADDKGVVLSTPNRADFRSIQTPQGFAMETIRSAHIRAAADNFSGTDDASLVEHMGETVHLVEGSRRNIKLTNPEDLRIMESLCSAEKNGMNALRVGQGFDVHRLVENRPLVLCGVDVPYNLGLLGHSDADVAVHALMDAILGAIALGDIGKLFPDSDEKYTDISSMLLLKSVMEIVRSKGASVVNADITIVAQKPKLAPYVDEMRKNLSAAMEVPFGKVSVKATTTEKLGYEGRGEGISAQAVVMMRV